MSLEGHLQTFADAQGKVRSTPESGHHIHHPACLLWATRRRVAFVALPRCPTKGRLRNVSKRRMLTLEARSSVMERPYDIAKRYTQLARRDMATGLVEIRAN